jgi:hypothetical protein
MTNINQDENSKGNKRFSKKLAPIVISTSMVISALMASGVPVLAAEAPTEQQVQNLEESEDVFENHGNMVSHYAKNYDGTDKKGQVIRLYAQENKDDNVPIEEENGDGETPDENADEEAPVEEETGDGETPDENADEEAPVEEETGDGETPDENADEKAPVEEETGDGETPDGNTDEEAPADDNKNWIINEYKTIVEEYKILIDYYNI